MYCNGRLIGEADDVRLRVEGPTTDLRSVQTPQDAPAPDENQDVVRESEAFFPSISGLVAGNKFLGSIDIVIS